MDHAWFLYLALSAFSAFAVAVIYCERTWKR